ncbi:MAG: glycosyltransferase family 4 protein [Patescibacteria group bacterium]
MKTILFIANESLCNLKKGTPIRVYNFIKEISRKHNLVLSAPDRNDKLDVKFYEYPPGNYISKLFYFVRIIRENKIDTIMTATEIGIALPVALKILTGSKIVIDLHGLYAEEMYYDKLIGWPRKVLIEQFTRFCLRFYDLVFTCTEKHKEYFKNINPNIQVIYEGVDEKVFFKEKKFEPEVFTIGYAGNLKEYQGIPLLLEACSNLHSKHKLNFRINLVISSGATHINDLLNKYNLLDVTSVYVKVDQEVANSIMSQSSVIVIPRPSIKITEYACPSKLTKSLITGIPTITTNVGSVRELFISSECCMVISGENIVVELELAILRVGKMSYDQKSKIGSAAISFVLANLTWDILGQKINCYLDKV